MAVYRFRRLRRYGMRRLTGRQVAAAVAGGAIIVLAVHHGGTAGQARASTVAATAAIAYARAQLGKPYLWGGTGPDSFDCSGLVMEAYADAGVTIERTSQEQWAGEEHVPASQVQVGDLVFFTGALEPGEQPPGHVGIVTDPAKDQMIDAYGTGVPIGYATYGPNATLEGLDQVVGFTQPWGGA